MAAAITRPVKAGVVVLLYIDTRMRKEGLDLALRGARHQASKLTSDEFAALWLARPWRAAAGRAGTRRGSPATRMVTGHRAARTWPAGDPALAGGLATAGRAEP